MNEQQNSEKNEVNEIRTLSSEEKTLIVEQIAEIIKVNYVYPDIGEKISKHLYSTIENNLYKNITTLEEFSHSILSNIEKIVVDKHNRVLVPGLQTEHYFKMANEMQERIKQLTSQETFDKNGINHQTKIIDLPIQVKRKGSPMVMQQKGAEPGKGLKMKVSRAEPSQKDTPKRMVRIGGSKDEENFKSGIDSVKILENNIGYLNISEFKSISSPDKEKMIESLNKMLI